VFCFLFCFVVVVVLCDRGGGDPTEGAGWCRFLALIAARWPAAWRPPPPRPAILQNNPPDYNKGTGEREEERKQRREKEANERRERKTGKEEREEEERKKKRRRRKKEEEEKQKRKRKTRSVVLNCDSGVCCELCTARTTSGALAGRSSAILICSAEEGLLGAGWYGFATGRCSARRRVNLFRGRRTESGKRGRAKRLDSAMGGRPAKKQEVEEEKSS